jgi:hypothetical protein
MPEWVHTGRNMTDPDLPHLAGVFAEEDLAVLIGVRLKSKGLPFTIQKRDHVPRIGVIEAIGRPVDDHKGPVNVVRTDYNFSSD